MTSKRKPQETYELGDLWFVNPEKARLITTPAAFRAWVLERGDSKFIAHGHIWLVKYRKGPAPGTIETYAERANL